MKKILVHFIALLCSVHCLAQSKTNNSLLWRINNDKTDQVSYLFGTIHLPQKKFVVYSDSVYDAIQQVKKFYNEVDFLNQSFFGDNELLDFLKEKGRYLDSLKNTDNWKNLIRRINKRYNANLDPTDLEAFVTFGQKILSSYYEPETGVTVPDLMLANFAKAIGKETGGLETYLLQFRMVYDIIDARVIDTTLEFKDEAELILNMKGLYLKEDLDGIARIVDDINPTYRKIVFDNRNILMGDSIAKHALREASFFAIGVGHLGGKRGVIEILRKKGFRLTPVHSDNKISMLVINNIISRHKNKEDDLAPAEVQELSDTKIDVNTETPPPPPPKQLPPKVEMKPAPKKTKGNQ